MTAESELVLLHNPRCSKSRRAREILVERGVAFRERRYLEDPLSRAELEELREKLGRPVHQWMRKKETLFKESGLSEETPEGELLDAMVAQPALLERPIVIRGDRAVVGRPPENIESLL